MTSISAATSAIGARFAPACTGSMDWSTTAGAIRTWSTPQYNNGEYFFKFTYDQLDNVRFPRDGQSFSLQWDANRTNLGADIAFDRVTADWLMARSSGRNTLLLWTSAGTTLDGNLQADGRAGLLFTRRVFKFVGPRAPIVAGTELCDRTRHLFPQDQPRRGGILRGSRLYRHVAGSGQYLGASRRDQLRHPPTRMSRSSWRSIRFSGPSIWVRATTSRATPGIICSSAAPSEGALRVRTRGFRRGFPPFRTPAPVDRRFASTRACATFLPTRGRARPP